MAPLRSEVSEDARADLARQYEWHTDEAGEDIAERYLEAFRRTNELLCREPSIGVLRRFRSPRLRGIRSFQLHGAFRVHLVFYRVDAEVLVIFRVLHGMRDLPRRLLQPPAADD